MLIEPFDTKEHLLGRVIGRLWQFANGSNPVFHSAMCTLAGTETKVPGNKKVKLCPEG